MVSKYISVLKIRYLFTEGSSNSYTATFRAGERSTNVDIQIEEDSIVETVKKYSFMLQNGSSQSVPLELGAPDYLQMDVMDNDGNKELLLHNTWY